MCSMLWGELSLLLLSLPPALHLPPPSAPSCMFANSCLPSLPVAGRGESWWRSSGVWGAGPPLFFPSIQRAQGWVGTGPHCCPPGPWKLVEFVTLQERPVQGGLLLACLSSSKSRALGWVESASLGGRVSGTLEQGWGQRQGRARLSLVDTGDREAQPSAEASTCNTSMAFFSFLLLQKNHSEAECFKHPAGQNAAEASYPGLLGLLPLGMLLAGVLTQANLLVFLAPVSPLIFFSSAHSSDGIQSC